MSWVCIPSTYFLESAEESLGTSCLDTLQSELSKSKTIPDAFYCNDNLTEFCQSFPFGTTLKRSELTTKRQNHLSKNSERCQGNSPFVAGSRNHAKTSARQEKVPACQENDQGFGLRWPASSAKYDHDTSSWKIHPCLFPEDSIECSVTLPRWGMMQGGALSELMPSVPIIIASEFGFMPTPTKGHTDRQGGSAWDQTGGSGASKMLQKLGWSKRDISQKRNPEYLEWQMGWPIKWSNLTPLGMDRFQQWLHSHGKS